MTSITSGFDDTELSCITSRAIAIDVGGSHMRCGLIGHQGILSVFDYPISPNSRLVRDVLGGIPLIDARLGGLNLRCQSFIEIDGRRRNASKREMINR